MTQRERFKEILNKIYKPEVYERLIANLDREGLNWNDLNSEEYLSTILACKLVWAQTPEGHGYWSDVHHALRTIEQKNRKQ